MGTMLTLTAATIWTDDWYILICHII